MGLYITVILATPIKKFQTKSFVNALNTYRMGDIVNYMYSSRIIIIKKKAILVFNIKN